MENGNLSTKFITIATKRNETKQHQHQPTNQQRLTKLTCKHIEIDLKERAGDQKFQILRQAKKADSRREGAVLNKRTQRTPTTIVTGEKV